jgi:hypothetical protein
VIRLKVSFADVFKRLGIHTSFIITEKTIKRLLVDTPNLYILDIVGELVVQAETNSLAERKFGLS